MKKPIRLLFIFVCVVSILAMTTGCAGMGWNKRLPETKPADFNFVFQFGVTAKNELDTVKGTFTKDMVTAPSVTTALKLTDAEMEEIYDRMKEIGILAYPDKFDPRSNAWQTPFITYSIKIIANGEEKSIHWNDEHHSERKDAVRLRELFARIQEIVLAKDEYKKLPPAQGGYD